MKTETQTRLTIAALLILFFLCMVIYNTVGLVRHIKKESERKAVAPIVEPYEPEDLDMKAARSNAAYFSKPPEGFDIVCDGQGRYAPRSLWKHGGGYVLQDSHHIRSNQSDALIETWRIKVAWDRIEAKNGAEAALPKPPPINWKPCE